MTSTDPALFTSPLDSIPASTGRAFTAILPCVDAMTSAELAVFALRPASSCAYKRAFSSSICLSNLERSASTRAFGRGGLVGDAPRNRCQNDRLEDGGRPAGLRQPPEA